MKEREKVKYNEPFNGSGTTGIVAAQNKRNYIGIDLNPEYLEITKRRVENELDY